MKNLFFLMTCFFTLSCSPSWVVEDVAIPQEKTTAQHNAPNQLPGLSIEAEDEFVATALDMKFEGVSSSLKTDSIGMLVEHSISLK